MKRTAYASSRASGRSGRVTAQARTVLILPTIDMT